LSVVLIAGGSGLIGQELKFALESAGMAVRFLSRGRSGGLYYRWNPAKDYIEKGALLDVSHVVNLAGSNIAGGRWTEERKRLILESRIESTAFLGKLIREEHLRVKSYTGVSAIGYYGAGPREDLCTEDSTPGDDFLSHVCVEWEKEMNLVASQGFSLRIFRLGVVLSKRGGAYPKMTAPVSWYMGATLGDGSNIMPWVSVEDVGRMIVWAIKNNIAGVYNAVSHETISQRELMTTVADVRGGFVWPVGVPKLFARLALGEMSAMLTEGVKVSNQKILDAGYRFVWPQILPFIRHLEGDHPC